jgi:hypothetical protein
MADTARSLRLISVAVIGALSLSACTNPPGTFSKAFSLSGDTSYSTDARQRVITSNEPKESSRPGLVDPQRIVCAEPSPDVAIAVANSFAVGASVLGQGSGSVSAAQAEGLAQLAERTVTVQLLRDQMYRACEAYANGAITGTTYSLIMSKNNKAMVTLMLGETAGGAFGRSLAAIGLEASAEAQAATQGLADNSAAMKKASDDLQAAEKEVAAAKEKLADKETNKKNVDAKEDSTTEEKAKAKDEVDEAKAELITAEAKRDAAAQRLNQSSEASSEAAAKIAELTAGGAIEDKPTAETAAVLADMQKQFLDTDFEEEYVSACLVELGLEPVYDDLQLEALETIQTRAGNIVLDDDDILLKNKTFLATEHIDPNVDPIAVHKRADQRLDTFLSLIKQNRRSKLAEHCAQRLFEFVTLANTNKSILKNIALDVELQGARARVIDARNRGLLAFNKAADTCRGVAPEETIACRNAIFALAKLGSDDAATDFAPAVRAVAPLVDSPVTIYLEAEAVKTLLEAEKAELGRLAIKDAPTGDATAAQEAQGLKGRLDELKEQVDQSLTEFAKDDTEAKLANLTTDRATAQSRMLAFAKDRKKTMLQREEQELAFKTFTNLSRQKYNKYEALKVKMTGQIDDIDELKNDVEDYNDSID